VISGDRGGQGVGPPLPIHLFGNVASKTDEHLNPSVEVHHIVGKLSTAENLLREVQRKVPTFPGKHLFVIRERHHAHPVQRERQNITSDYTRVGTLIVATIYLHMIQNRYMFRSFSVLHCSHQHCIQPVSSDVEVVGYL